MTSRFEHLLWDALSRTYLTYHDKLSMGYIAKQPFAIGHENRDNSGLSQRVRCLLGPPLASDGAGILIESERNFGSIGSNAFIETDP